MTQITATFIFLMFSCTLLAQQTVVKISDYEYSSTFNDRKCSEYLRVTAYFSTGEAPNTFINNTNGNATAQDRSYTLEGSVDRLVVSVFAADGRNGSIFGCFGGALHEVQETYDLPINTADCVPSTISDTNANGSEVEQSFSFDYQVIVKPGVTGIGTFNITGNTIGYEELFSLTADVGFNESVYQWQYRVGSQGEWSNIPRPPSRELKIRLIDFVDRSVIDQDVFFRIANCDDIDSVQTVVSKSVKEYENLTKITLTDFDFDRYFRDGRCDKNSRRVTLKAVFSDGTPPITFFSHDPKYKLKFSKRDYILPGVIERMEISIKGKDKSWRGRCGAGRNSVSGLYKRNAGYDNPCQTRFFKKTLKRKRNGVRQIQLWLEFNYKFTPIPKITRTIESDFIGYEDEFTLSALEGFSDNVYDWEYAFLDDNPLKWRDVPGSSGPTRDIILADFLEESNIGKEIIFRTVSCDDLNLQNVVSYKIRRSAPRIVNVTTTPVSCYGGNNGTITLTLDRPLITGDLFYFSIANADSPTDIIANANDITLDDINAQNQLTIRGLEASNQSEYIVKMFGRNNGEVYYTDSSYHQATFQIATPTPVGFVGEPTNTAVNVRCYDGQDGAITLTAEGGVGNYEYLIRNEEEEWDEDGWVAFSDVTAHTIDELLANTYYMKIRDANGCVAREQALVDGAIDLRDEIVKVVEITEPMAPLTLTTEILNVPTAFGFEDGRILATINGGTPANDGSYTFEWKDENGTVITTTTAAYNEGQGYLVTLHSVGTGAYTLTVTDANYNSATDKEGCTVVSEIVILEQPTAIEINLEVTPISCNQQNEFSNNIDTNFDGVADQFQDGVIVATITGGVPYDIENPDLNADYPVDDQGVLLPYFYNWKIQLSNGNWQELDSKNTVINFLDTSTNYSLNVTDNNGIVVGNYTATAAADGSRIYELAAATDVVTYVAQPEPLVLDFTTTIVSCASGNDASAVAQVMGGIAPYRYEWSNGQTTAAIENLIAGMYAVYVTDAKGCEIEGTVTVEQANQITINPITVKTPICAGGNDGQIRVELNGGREPYTYLWNTGETSNQLQNVAAGTYRLEVTDASGCKAFYEETLIDPEPVVVNLIEKRDLCQAQFVELDITIDDSNAIYLWTSDIGFTSNDSTVILTETGVYTATITNSLGCVGVGTVTITAFDTPIDADFLTTTQAYTEDEVMLINVSNPLGDNVIWTIPEDVEIVVKSEDGLILKFKEKGTYDINLRSYQGGCYQDYIKTILVLPAISGPSTENTSDKFIEEFILYPNPSNGTFKTKISLAEVSNATVKIMDLRSGTVMDERSGSNGQEFLLDYALSLPSGLYLVLLETPKGSETRKLIVK